MQLDGFILISDSAVSQQAVKYDESVLSPDDMAALSDEGETSLEKSFTQSLVQGISKMLTENTHGHGTSKGMVAPSVIIAVIFEM